MPNNYFISGEWNTICDVCGQKKKSHELQKRWDGLYVCSKDWETRHPQDLIRIKADKQTVAWTRPEAEDTFKDICYLWGISAFSDLAEADCSQADKQSPPYPLLKQLKQGI
jgi:hypothetical protein